MAISVWAWSSDQEIPIALLFCWAPDRNRCASKGANSYEPTPREKAGLPLERYWSLQWAGLNSGDSSSTTNVSLLVSILQVHSRLIGLFGM